MNQNKNKTVSEPNQEFVNQKQIETGNLHQYPALELSP